MLDYMLFSFSVSNNKLTSLVAGYPERGCAAEPQDVCNDVCPVCLGCDLNQCYGEYALDAHGNSFVG